MLKRRANKLQLLWLAYNNTDATIIGYRVVCSTNIDLQNNTDQFECIETTIPPSRTSTELDVSKLAVDKFYAAIQIVRNINGVDIHENKLSPPAFISLETGR